MTDVKLFLKHYFISEINLRLNSSFKPQKEPISINPIFSRSINKIDDNSASVSIRVEIKDEGNKPFIGFLTIQGVFKCDNYESTEDGLYLMKTTTTMVLFPYLRQALSTATTLLNVPPYVLPVVNVSNLFEANEENE